MTKIAQILVNGLSRGTVAELAADALFSYVAGAYAYVRPGDTITTDDGHSYEVAASDATDHDLITAGGVKLYVLPGARGWDIAAFASTVTSASIKRALEKAFNALGGSVVASPGRYFLDTLVDAAWPSTGGFVRMVTIDFEGAVFEVPASNTTGGFKITTQNNFQQMRIRNVEIQSAAPIGVDGDPTNGIGFHVYSALRPGHPGWGQTASKQVTLENVNVVSKGPSLYGRWDKGIRIDGFWWPELVGCWAATRHPGTDFDYTYETGEGIGIWNCYSPLLIGCYAAGRWLHNIRIDDDSESLYEDFQLTGCYGTGGRDGLTIGVSSPGMIASSLKEPGGRVSGGHFNGHRYGINVENRRQFTIDGVLIYTTVQAGHVTYADSAFLRLHNCRDADVASIQVPEGGHYVSDADCSRHIHLSGDTDAVRIHSCKLGANGISIYNDATGTKNIAQDNDFTAFGGPTTVGPTKKIVDTTGTLRGGDVVVAPTPVLLFGGANTGMTYAARDAGWVKNGRTVTFWGQIELSAKGSSTGNANISLPGMPAPVTGSDFAVSISYGTSANAAPTGGRIDASGQIELYRLGTNNNLGTRVTDADISDTTQIRLSGSYVAA